MCMMLCEGSVEGDDVNNCSGAGDFKITGVALLRRQMFALFVKRFLYVMRDKKGFICQVPLNYVLKHCADALQFHVC